jgi:pimeloyl-ACP methyl ester carboxylesterase
MRRAAGAIAAMGVAASITLTLSSPCAAGTWLVSHPEVTGAEIADADVRREGASWASTAWDDLTHTTLEPGRYEVRVRAISDKPGEAVQIPVCAGRIATRIDGRAVGNEPGPVVVPVSPGAHEVVISIDVSRYERRVACGERVRVGRAEETTSSGLGLLVFESPHDARGGGKAVVYVPPGHNLHKLGKVLVGLHPWNGSIWTYAAYQELLGEARARGVLLLMPSGLGNSLYTADAEDEVLRAMDALSSVARVPFPSRDLVHGWDVSIWGASMGGAGATTIAFHQPDRFVAVTSFFGDSSYDLSTYVRAILHDQRAAHQVNALDVVDNARYLPVRLIHGEDDATSPIRQSEILADALQQRGYAVRFDRVPGIGHAGALVARFLPEVVAAAATTSGRAFGRRVTYRSVRPSDIAFSHVVIERTSPTADAFIDLEGRQDGIHVLHIDGVQRIIIPYDFMSPSCRRSLPVFFEDPISAVPVVRLAQNGCL